MRGLGASFTVRNTGKREGADVAQLYLVSRKGEAKLRLAGFARVNLAAGAEQTVRLTIDPRILADWKDGRWTMPAGDYTFALGKDAATLSSPVSVKLPGRQWKD